MIIEAWKGTVVCTVLLALFVLPGRSHAAAGTTACFDGDPATPVPEFVNNERIWPPSGLQPAIPNMQLPVIRDSSRYKGLPSQLPGAGSGLELWTDLDIVGNYIYTSYNAGLQIWDISGANAADPQRTAFRDGWSTSHFLHFEELPTEVLFLIFGIDAIDPPTAGEDVLIALAGHTPAGFSIWDATSKTSLLQLYQDYDRWGEDVAAAHINGRTYAFFAMGSGGGAGLHVYDMTSARGLATPCLEDTTTAITCPNVYKGEMGSWSKVRFVSHLEHNSRHFIAVSDGSSGYGVDIHEVLNPATAWSNPVFSGLSTSSQGVQLFAHGGRAYMAVKGATDMQIYDATTCLDSGNCSTLQSQSPVWSATAGGGTAASLVSVSEGSDPYVYFGTPSPCQQGTRKEHLFNVDALGVANPTLEEATAFPAGSSANSDGLFQDAVAGHDVDYWGYYLDRNTGGFSYITPRAAKVHRASNGAEYVYRAGFTIFDVHVFGDFTPPPNVPSATVTGPSTGWLGDSVAFTATPRNCDGTAQWQWWYEEGDPPSVTLGQDDATHTEQWNVGAARSLAVGATRLACNSGETMLDENVAPQAITLNDPRPKIPGISPAGTYPQGQQLTFGSTGEISGKEPFDYKWRVLNGSGVDGAEIMGLPNTTGATFSLDTCALPTTDIFEDGFESGNVTLWSLAVGTEPESATSPIAAPAKAAPTKTGEVRFTVEFTATATVQAGPFSDTASVMIDIAPPGVPEFEAPPISSADRGSGSYDLSINTNDLETEVRWQIEDDNGESTCDFGSGDTDCVVFEWGDEGSQVTHQWSTPNIDGLHKVSAQIRSLQCDGSFLPAVPPLGQVDVDVENITSPVDPEINLWEIIEDANCSCSFGTCQCVANQPVTFKVTTNVAVGALVFTWGDGQVDTFQPPTNDDLYTHSYSPGQYTVKVKILGDESTERTFSYSVFIPN